jgi:hypothetical protein
LNAKEIKQSVIGIRSRVGEGQSFKTAMWWVMILSKY